MVASRPFLRMNIAEHVSFVFSVLHRNSIPSVNEPTVLSA